MIKFLSVIRHAVNSNSHFTAQCQKQIAITSLTGLLLLISDTSIGQSASGPQIQPTTSFQSQTVFAGATATMSVTAIGSEPLSFQWRLDGQPLPSQTHKTLTIAAAQPTDEGDYTVVISNGFGAITNDIAARLYVVPIHQFVKGNFTNQPVPGLPSLRLPYFYELPVNYEPARSYPLVCFFHGCCGLRLDSSPPCSFYLALLHLTSQDIQHRKPKTMCQWVTPVLAQRSPLLGNS